MITHSEGKTSVDQALNLQTTAHTPPSLVSYGLSIVEIAKDINLL